MMTPQLFSTKRPTLPPTSTKARLTSFAPQFLVDDLERAIAYYQRIGFSFGEPWDGFYAMGHLDGLELHLKEAPKNQAERRWRRDNEHLDASAGVDGGEAFYEQCVANGATIMKPLAGDEGFLCRGPRRLHHLLWRQPSAGHVGTTQGLKLMTRYVISAFHHGLRG